jgi:hypothetical protein
VRLATAEAAPTILPVAATPVLALPDKPSIAVLPFQNMTGDPEQEYFADGMVEEITTALSRIRWLFVIARNSSFSYKGQSHDVRQVGAQILAPPRPDASPRCEVRRAVGTVGIYLWHPGAAPAAVASAATSSA